MNLGLKNPDTAANRLKNNNVLPLPIERLKKIKDINIIDNDPNKKSNERLFELLNQKICKTFLSLLPNVKYKKNKLQQSILNILDVYSSGIVYNYAVANKSEKIIWIHFDLKKYFLTISYPEITIIYIPLIDFIMAINKLLLLLFRIPYKLLLLIVNFFTLRNKTDNNNKEFENIKFAYVVHEGLSYGNLYNKNLIYSKDSSHFRHVDNILHITYSDEKLNVKNQINLSSKFLLSTCYNYLPTIFKSLIYVRSVSDLWLIFYFLSLLMKIKSTINQLSNYNFKTAFIDYDLVCPTHILFALETLKCQSIAVEERPYGSYYNYWGSMVNHYLCSSEKNIARLKTKKIGFWSDKYYPVGMYRSDYLISFKDDYKLSQQYEFNNNKNFIVSLGYQTPHSWYLSNNDPILNWTAHEVYLNDMILFANEFSDSIIVIRSKINDWYYNPHFSEVIKRINNQKNLFISTDYSTPWFSYKLCAKADLVIGRQTSLLDECLSVGKPTLYYDYTHNIKSFFKELDYLPKDIFCTSIDEMINKSKLVLNGDLFFASLFRDIKSKYYEDYNDGHVINRVHKIIDDIHNETSFYQPTSFEMKINN